MAHSVRAWSMRACIIIVLAIFICTALALTRMWCVTFRPRTEAGFSSQQDSQLAGLGCNPPSAGYVDGGIDTQTAEAVIAQSCSVVLPRIENGEYKSLLDECGGHTNEVTHAAPRTARAVEISFLCRASLCHTHASHGVSNCAVPLP